MAGVDSSWHPSLERVVSGGNASRNWSLRRLSPVQRSAAELREEQPHGLTQFPLIGVVEAGGGAAHAQRSAAEPAWIRLRDSLEFHLDLPSFARMPVKSNEAIQIIKALFLKFWGVWIVLPCQFGYVHPLISEVLGCVDDFTFVSLGTFTPLYLKIRYLYNRLL